MMRGVTRSSMTLLAGVLSLIAEARAARAQCTT
jgi:hypothetical protein